MQVCPDVYTEDTMNFERLEKNLCDNILEAQIKLGFDGRPMSLNYMTTSLRHLVGRKCSEKEMEHFLFNFADFVEPRLGNISFRPITNGFCITVPAEGTAYINNLSDGKEFIRALVEAVRSHSQLDEIVGIFRKYSDNVAFSDTDNDEFQYLIYFIDGVPDEYRYCISVDEEMDGSSHVTYHRFIKEDYDDLGF